MGPEEENAPDNKRFITMDLRILDKRMFKLINAEQYNL